MEQRFRPFHAPETRAPEPEDIEGDGKTCENGHATVKTLQERHFCPICNILL